MIFTNHLISIKELDREVLHQFLILLNPFAPHISEELNQKIGFEPITSLDWPDYDDKLIVDEKITMAVQFNGKTRGTIQVPPGISQDDAILSIKETVFGDKYLSKGDIIKIIHIPDKIINVIIK